MPSTSCSENYSISPGNDPPIAHAWRVSVTLTTDRWLEQSAAGPTTTISRNWRRCCANQFVTRWRLPIRGGCRATRFPLINLLPTVRLLLSVRLLPTMRLLRLRSRYCRVRPGNYLHSDNEQQDYLARLGVSAKILFVRQFAHRGEAEEKRTGHYNEEHHTAKGKDSGLRHRQSFFGNALSLIHI